MALISKQVKLYFKPQKHVPVAAGYFRLPQLSGVSAWVGIPCGVVGLRTGGKHQKAWLWNGQVEDVAARSAPRWRVRLRVGGHGAEGIGVPAQVGREGIGGKSLMFG